MNHTISQVLFMLKKPFLARRYSKKELPKDIYSMRCRGTYARTPLDGIESKRVHQDKHRIKTNSNNNLSTLERMRDMKELSLSQEADVDHDTVNRALGLNEELAKLKEEIEKLNKENRLRKDKEALLLEELEQREELLAASAAEVKRLKEETHRQSVSLDSVFSDLEESKRLVTKLRKERCDKQPGADSEVNDPDVEEESQAQFLTSAGKSAQSPGSFFSSIGGTNSAQQRKMFNLERENLKLKSELVRLQAHYREESYLNRRAIEDLKEETLTTGTESIDSLSQNEDSDDSNSIGEGQNPRPNLARSSSLRRIKEYKDRKASLPPTPTNPAGTKPVRQLQRIGSLRSNLMRPILADSSDDDDGPGLPPRAQSLRPDATGDRSTPLRIETTPTTTRAPRRIQSLQPSSREGKQVNLHEIGEEAPSRVSLFARSQSIRSMGWWQ